MYKITETVGWNLTTSSCTECEWTLSAREATQTAARHHTEQTGHTVIFRAEHTCTYTADSC